MAAARVERLRRIVGAVARQAMRDRGARRLALLHDGSPEAELARTWLDAELAAGTLITVGPEGWSMEPLLQPAGAEIARERLLEEALRFRARLLPDTLVANPINKTALLLGGAPPPEPLLPLGDLYASEIEALAGGWSAPPQVRALAERAGGLGRLDQALRSLLERRNSKALDVLGAAARDAVDAALARGRAARVIPTVVPKIGYRTLGVDLLQ